MIDFCKRVYRQSQDGELRLVATSLAYSTVLCLIPFMAVALAILQKMNGLEAIYPKVEKFILSNFSETAGLEGIRLIKIALGRMMPEKLGVIGSIFLLVTSTRLFSDMDFGINRVWNIPKRRRLLKRMVIYWLLILSFPFALAVYVAINSTREYTNVSQQVGQDLLKWLILSTLLFVVYKLVPDLKVKVGSALMGAFVGSLLTITIHKVFVWASQKVFIYGKVYGSIAALPLMLLWVLLLWYGILCGAIVSASFKRVK